MGKLTAWRLLEDDVLRLRGTAENALLRGSDGQRAGEAPAAASFTNTGSAWRNAASALHGWRRLTRIGVDFSRLADRHSWHEAEFIAPVQTGGGLAQGASRQRATITVGADTG